MKKFKFFFYGVYLLYFAFIAFIALNYEAIVIKWSWDPIDTWTGLLRFVLKIGGIGTVLFITVIIVENIHLFSKNRKISSLETEVQDLKAKLYDKSQESAISGDDNTSLPSEKPNTDPHENVETTEDSVD